MNILFFLTPKEEVAYVEEDDSLRQVVERLEYHGYSAIPLLSKDGKYIGTITEGDILWEMKDKDYPDVHRMEKIRIMEVPRRRDNEAVNVQESMENLYDKITNQNFVPVVDDDQTFIGIVTRKDIIVYLAKKVKEQEEKEKTK
ncbi:MAG: CBS domain-containing protein [Roseburia sp.]|uniref:CBS domain-containing protein n=1 Tax=Roseburia sp. 831b TaxID=1261635 RepID=UPI000952E9E4|nr:CBS domain-containing protein [Roseburia sp. 831b]MCI5919345.1 CBS domain-containing protein [Roseburia sp.]MDD6217377.1 CBS domain-containing protein [Roseburia sp.]WVK72972.1 CBS domain-containing protein [Roseburia sp. 831b]